MGVNRGAKSFALGCTSSFSAVLVLLDCNGRTYGYMNGHTDGQTLS